MTPPRPKARMGTSRRAEALALLGIARRAGAVVTGTDATRRSLRKHDVRLVLLAQDGSQVQRRKVIPLAQAQGIPWKNLGDRAQLGSAVGEGPLTAVGVLKGGFAKSLLERLGRD
jgi:ribosomal protein L7Ae-like RNA K-turn-binding protein